MGKLCGQRSNFRGDRVNIDSCLLHHLTHRAIRGPVSPKQTPGEKRSQLPKCDIRNRNPV